MAGRSAFAIAVSCVALVFVGARAPVVHAADDVAPLYNAAQNYFVHGDVAGGLAALEQAVAVDPGNTDVLVLRAFWADEAGNVVARDDSVNRLGELAPTVRAAVLDALRAIDKALTTRINLTPTPHGPETAIVILGFGLLPDGSMRPELIDRLQVGLRAAAVAPSSPIITTGGNPQHDITEGQAMAAWLVGQHIDPSRIPPETEATSTVQNALFSAPIIHALGADDAVLVSSADHIRRATADFEIAGVSVVDNLVPTDYLLSSQLLPVQLPERWGIYLDGTKVFGLPATLPTRDPPPRPDTGSGSAS
ncbi:ElyC/SanA/YdcF family protein [Nocardia sp. NPDC049149]|uniref:YdcF family protein n=1 Tax=Nocardia sp. NPDC049149 TaxID=3364315 RepID=UPI00371734B5